MTETLASALAQLQKNLPRITKGETAVVPTKSGGSFKYTYAGLGHVSDVILKAMGALGLSWVTKPTLNEQREFVLAYKLQHISGGEETGEYPLPKGTPQEMGSAITYARRYCLCAVTGVAPDDDDDDGAAAQKAAAAPRRRPAPEPVDTGPTLITPSQMRKMQALFTRCGITDPQAKRDYAAEVIGHPLESATQLTTVEAAHVIDRITSDYDPAGKVEGQP